MDLNPDAATRLDAGVRFLEHDCTSPWPLPDASLDLVFSSNFLEHLPDKAAVAAALREARRCLAPGGRIVLVGPNLRFTGGAYWDFWDHHVPLTERSLAEGLELFGFRVEECIPRFLPYTMSQGRNPPLPLVSLYLRWPWIWRFAGRQFLLTARVDESPGRQ
jgi:SAM-dependent methyltransferase